MHESFAQITKNHSGILIFTILSTVMFLIQDIEIRVFNGLVSLEKRKKPKIKKNQLAFNTHLKRV